MSEQPTNQQELSEEEMIDIRNKQQKFYEDNLPFLRVQSEYEELQAKIVKSRYEKAAYKVQHAQLDASMKEQSKSQE